MTDEKFIKKWFNAKKKLVNFSSVARELGVENILKFRFWVFETKDGKGYFRCPECPLYPSDLKKIRIKLESKQLF